jgi:hypothetical protein
MVGSPKNPPSSVVGLDVDVGGWGLACVGVDSPVGASLPLFVVGSPKNPPSPVVGLDVADPGEIVGALVPSFKGSPVYSIALAEGLGVTAGIFVSKKSPSPPVGLPVGVVGSPKNSPSPSVGLPVGITVPGSSSGSGISSATDNTQRHNASNITADDSLVEKVLILLVFRHITLLCSVLLLDPLYSLAVR